MSHAIQRRDRLSDQLRIVVAFDAFTFPMEHTQIIIMHISQLLRLLYNGRKYILYLACSFHLLPLGIEVGKR